MFSGISFSPSVFLFWISKRIPFLFPPNFAGSWKTPSKWLLVFQIELKSVVSVFGTKKLLFSGTHAIRSKLGLVGSFPFSQGLVSITYPRAIYSTGGTGFQTLKAVFLFNPERLIVL